MKNKFLFIILIFLTACSTATPLTAPTLQPRPTLPPPTQAAPITAAPTAKAASPTTAPTIQSMVTGKYLMSFHACDESKTNCRDPRSHEVYLAQSDDGVAWKLIPNWKSFRGSVPDVIRRGNTLYIYTASSDVVKYRLDTGATETARIKVNGLAGFADPSLIIDGEGRLVLFMLNGFVQGGDPASCPPGQTTCEKYMDAAVEVKGSDGTEFNLESGHRATVQLGGEFRSASDPDIFFDGKQYVMYVSHGPSITAWTATTLLGAYSRLTNLSTNLGGIPAGYFDASAKMYWTYAHVNENGRAVIRRATHTALSPLTAADFKTVLTGATIGLGATFHVESPGFAVNVP
ncbi:MAG: hypothetical protein HZC38_03845 [Chloroflexi bacterium]|nr:hypothetical protein [Chloroflexota bacterium]